MLWQGEQFNTDQIIGKVKRDVHCRVYMCNRNRSCKKYMEWFLGMLLIERLLICCIIGRVIELLFPI